MACGSRWPVPYLLFRMINGREELDAMATQLHITSHNETLKLIRKEKWEEEKAGECKK